jgi:hypothetical protein
MLQSPSRFEHLDSIVRRLRVTADQVTRKRVSIITTVNVFSFILCACLHGTFLVQGDLSPSGGLLDSLYGPGAEPNPKWPSLLSRQLSDYQYSDFSFPSISFGKLSQSAPEKVETIDENVKFKSYEASSGSMASVVINADQGDTRTDAKAGPAYVWKDPESPENLKRFLEEIERLGRRPQFVSSDEGGSARSSGEAEGVAVSDSTGGSEGEDEVIAAFSKSFRARKLSGGFRVTGAKKVIDYFCSPSPVRFGN